MCGEESKCHLALVGFVVEDVQVPLGQGDIWVWSSEERSGGWVRKYLVKVMGKLMCQLD